MENPTQPVCSTSGCTRTPVWSFAPAFFWEAPDVALEQRGKLRCADHLDLDELRRMPGAVNGMVVVLDPRPRVSPAAAPIDFEHSDTERMASHLIDVAELRPSVTSDATELIRTGRHGSSRPPVPGVYQGPGTDWSPR